MNLLPENEESELFGRCQCDNIVLAVDSHGKWSLDESAPHPGRIGRPNHDVCLDHSKISDFLD